MVGTSGPTETQTTDIATKIVTESMPSTTHIIISTTIPIMPEDDDEKTQHPTVVIPKNDPHNNKSHRFVVVHGDKIKYCNKGEHFECGQDNQIKDDDSNDLYEKPPDQGITGRIPLENGKIIYFKHKKNCQTEPEKNKLKNEGPKTTEKPDRDEEDNEPKDQTTDKSDEGGKDENDGITEKPDDGGGRKIQKKTDKADEDDDDGGGTMKRTKKKKTTSDNDDDDDGGRSRRKKKKKKITDDDDDDDETVKKHKKKKKNKSFDDEGKKDENDPDLTRSGVGSIDGPGGFDTYGGRRRRKRLAEPYVIIRY